MMPYSFHRDAIFVSSATADVAGFDVVAARVTLLERDGLWHRSEDAKDGEAPAARPRPAGVRVDVIELADLRGLEVESRAERRKVLSRPRHVPPEVTTMVISATRRRRGPRRRSHPMAASPVHRLHEWFLLGINTSWLLRRVCVCLACVLVSLG